MERTFWNVLSGCLAFLLAGGAIVFLGWLLWWLWSRQREEEEGGAVEFELDAAAAGRGAGMESGVGKEAPPMIDSQPVLPEPEATEALLPEPGVDEPDKLFASRAAVEVETPPPQPVPFVEIEGPGGPDDLRIIEGIGPRIAGVLRAGGIRTFQDLADTDVAQIEAILRAEDPRLLRLCKPDTWPEQAALAAAGNWDGLQALIDALKRGRRV